MRSKPNCQLTRDSFEEDCKHVGQMHGLKDQKKSNAGFRHLRKIAALKILYTSDVV